MDIDVNNAETVEIPLAPEADLVKILLEFDPEELEMDARDRPSLFLLERACALKGWNYTGSHPRFYINRWVELVFSGERRLMYRVLNARSHQNRPLSLEAILSGVESSLAVVDQYQTDVQKFLENLHYAYEELRKEEQSPVKLNAVYEWLYHRHPRYRREQFGLDLNQLTDPEKNRFGELRARFLAGEGSAREAFSVYNRRGERLSMQQVLFEPAPKKRKKKPKKIAIEAPSDDWNV